MSIARTLVACCFALLSTAPVRAAGQAPLEPALAAVAPKVIAWRRDLHAHPELVITSYSIHYTKLYDAMKEWLTVMTMSPG